MKTLLAAMITVLPAVACAQGAVGNWASVDFHPRACTIKPEGSLEVSRSGLLLMETSCSFESTAPVGFGGLRGELQCSAEGEPYAMHIDMQVSGDLLLLAVDGAPAVQYRRC